MPKKHDKARKAAVAALMRVHRGGWANMAANSAWQAASLDSRDAAFAGALFFCTVERLATLDFLLGPYLKRPLEKLDVEVRAVLETGAAQLLYMQVPARAAVDESVKLARALGKSSAAGMVNAVLRRMAEAWPVQDGAVPGLSGLRFDTELQRVCVTWAVGEAVARAVMGALPEEYDAFFAASFGQRELCLRANTLKTDREALARRLGEEGAGSRPGALPDALYATLPGGVAHSAAFADGLYHVQGEASQYACACLDAQPGQRVLDLCAAPGGKSATLAQQMGGGEGLCACDIREQRLGLITQAFGRLGIERTVVRQNDATVHDPELEGQDRVLCDVPCSGLGVLRQKPDMRYTDGAGFEALPPLQLKILGTACRYIKRGGRLVYSTCTVRPEENQQVVRGFLAEHGGEYRLVRPVAVPRGVDIIDDMMTILPHKTGMDGFFVASLERL